MGDQPAQTKPNESTPAEVNQDELILQQQRRIEKEIQETTALIGEKESLKALESEYTEDEVYLSKAKALAQKYSYFRRTRPDGNCFFRAFSYAYLEKLLNNKEEFVKFRELAYKSKDNLVELGFPRFTVEDFHDTFMEVIDKVGEGKEDSYIELHRLFNIQGYSDYVVVYLRLITSGQLQREAEFYQHFIEGDRTVKEFCHQEVEPMYKESDHIHIIAMSTALNTGVRVRYMDRGAGTEVTAHDFPEGSTPSVHLLYRPDKKLSTTMASASSTSARSLFVESKMRLADRVQVNINNIASLTRQIQRGSKSNEILTHSVKNFVQQDQVLESAEANLKKLSLIATHLEYQLNAIDQSSTKLEEVTEQVRAMQR